MKLRLLLLKFIQSSLEFIVLSFSISNVNNIKIIEPKVYFIKLRDNKTYLMYTLKSVLLSLNVFRDDFTENKCPFIFKYKHQFNINLF